MKRTSLPKRVTNKFHHPSEEEFDYEPMLKAMRTCREQVSNFHSATGMRNPVYDEAQALIERIDAVVKLSRYPDAEKIVIPIIKGH